MQPLNPLTSWANFLVIEKSYQWGGLAPAALLQQHSHMLLTQQVERQITMVALLDLNASTKPMLLNQEQLLQIAADCRALVNQMYNQSFVVEIQLWLVGEGSAQVQQQLSSLSIKKGSLRISGFILSQDAVWTTNSWYHRLTRRYLQQIIETKRSPKAAPLIVAKRPSKYALQPLMTYVLLASFLLYFFAELYISDSAVRPNGLIINAMGADSYYFSIILKDYYRLITAMFMHASWMHLIFNGVAFYIAGSALEKMLHRGWLLIFFVVCGLGASLGSALYHHSYMPSVGASGGIMGLLTILLLLAYRIPPGVVRRQVQSTCLRILIPSMLPILGIIGNVNVDYANHIVGAVTGALVGGAMLLLWPARKLQPYGNRAIPWVAGAISIGVILCFVWAAVNYSNSRLALEELLRVISQ